MPTVLIVEDDQAILDMVTEILEDEGYTVTGAINGRRALDQLTTCIPDVMITDITMPEMDGVELCATVQAQSSLAHIPILVMSAGTNHLLAETCQCSAFLAKPFSITALVSTVAALLDPPPETCV